MRIKSPADYIKELLLENPPLSSDDVTAYFKIIAEKAGNGITWKAVKAAYYRLRKANLLRVNTSADFKNNDGQHGENTQQADALVNEAEAREKEEQNAKARLLEDLHRRKEVAKVKELENKYKLLLGQFEESEKRLDFALNITTKEQPLNIVQLDPVLSSDRHEAVPVIQLSDWHFEERVDPATINGMNEYNLDIAKSRWHKCIQNSLKLVYKERHSADISQAIIWLGGDMISGWIHEELEESNYLSPTQATRFATEQIITALKFYVEHGKFKKLLIVCNFGNHGRTQKKPRISTNYRNSYEWMMYHNIKDYFSGHTGVTKMEFIIPNGIFNYVRVLEKYNCRFWHGDTIKYGGGIGGLTVPLIKAITRYNQQQLADYNFMGHYHQLWQATKDCIVNGSGIGFNAYAQSIGASPEEPKQGFSLIDKKYGMTTKMEIYCK